MKDKGDFSAGKSRLVLPNSGRTLDEILEQEKPEVVAAAKEKAAAILLNIHRAELNRKT